MNIAVLVSGGVDSSVALKILKDQGHEVTAFYIKIWLEDELAYLGNCPWQEDLAYVRAVCAQLNVPLEIISLQKEYKDQVVSYTIAEVKAGRTPNPDILCNQRIKFGAFFDAIAMKRYDKVATGHYANVIKEHDVYRLKMAPDALKDQTYFLSHVSQEQLARALFPIGHLTKAEVRALAHAYNLPTKDRKDSQGICFLGKIPFKDFLAHHLGRKEGNLIEYETGTIVGKHEGYWFYTIGQRQGLGLAGGPWYVVAKDVANNIVFISRNYYAADKMRTTFTIRDLNWISVPTKQDLAVKLRHGKHLNACTIALHDDGSVQVQLQQRDQGIAPGQFAVFYDGDYCLGSGVIQ